MQTQPHFPHTQLSLDRFDSTAEAARGRTRWPVAAVGCSTTATATHSTSATAVAAASSDIAPVRSAVRRLPCPGRGTTAAARVINCPMFSDSAANGSAGSAATAR